MEIDITTITRHQKVFWIQEDPKTGLWYFEAAWFDRDGEFREYQSRDFASQEECLAVIENFDSKKED